jgi:hypothetical protein
MKKNKLLLISILLISIISTIYATSHWQAWWWVTWIWEPGTTSRFTWPTTIDWVSAYTDSFTWFNWQATQTSWDVQWDGMNWAASFTHCTNLWWAWRLPTKEEMFSIMTDREVNWSGRYTKLESITDPSYWSSTPSPFDINYAWDGGFWSGTVVTNSKTYHRQVLCIHDAVVVSTYPWCDTPDITVWAYTISACNVWTNTASTAYNDAGWYWELFQWWNNAWIKTAWTSPTQISVSNIDSTYTSATFIYDTPDWNTTENDNMWWDTTDTDEARIWPCEVWYHVPTNSEWAWIHTAWWWWTNWLNMSNALKMPMAGARNYSSADLNINGSYGGYWSTSLIGSAAYRMYFGSTYISPSASSFRAHGYSVRCFKDSPAPNTDTYTNNDGTTTTYLADNTNSVNRFTLSWPVWWTSTVLDNITWLTWQSEWVTQWTMTWLAAKSYCAALTLWWQSDWRVPDITELESIIDLSSFSPAIDTIFFTASNNYYWSSTTLTTNTGYAWVGSYYLNKTTSYFVRCVR